MSNHSHDGHRQRMKERCKREGMENFQEHEVLEFLLFYAIPYRDTNDLAHQLLKRFGNLAGVFGASYEDLLTVSGMGPNAAMLLSAIRQITRYYEKVLWQPKEPLLDTMSMAAYLKPLFIGAEKEMFYLLCLNAQNQVIHVVKLAEGSLSEVVVYPAQVVKEALLHKSRSVVLAHNHPGNSLRPTSSDLSLTKTLVDALRMVSIRVLDHIVIAGDQYVSFVERGYMKQAED